VRIETAEQLSRKLRALADKVQRRLWVAVPYVGGWKAITSLLGLRWRDFDEVRFRLLTDVTNKGWLDRNTIEVMNSHGSIKHLVGLHAKLYIVDDHALVTSANLTEKAFSRRHEMGIFLSPGESKQVIRTFEDWWDNIAEFPPDGWMKTLAKSSPNSSKEEPGASQPTKLYSLPPAPSDHQSVSPLFRDYKAFMTSYRELADTYVALGGRTFPKAPLYIETDMFLNHLYHGDGQPSKQYRNTRSPRSLTKTQQRAEIKKYLQGFRRWASAKGVAEIKRRTAASFEAARLLTKNRLRKIEWGEVERITKIIHCMKRNRTKFRDENQLSTIKQEWEFLLHETDVPIEARMTRCYERLIGFGQSAVQELPGWYNPKKYPIRNGNSNAGLRFLGY